MDQGSKHISGDLFVSGDIVVGTGTRILGTGGIEVSPFGAVGDADVADDTAPLQAALDACLATGQPIDLAPGVYGVSSTLTFVGAGDVLVMRGSAGNTVINGVTLKWIGPRGAGPLLEVRGSWRPVIEGIDFDGDALVETVVWLHSDQAAAGVGLQGPTIRHCGFTDCDPTADDPVLLRFGETTGGPTYQCDLLVVERCTFLGSLDDPDRVKCFYSEQGGNTKNFAFRDCYLYYCRYGIDLLHHSGTQVIDNCFSGGIHGPIRTVSAVDTVEDSLTVTNHGLQENDRFRVTATVTKPGGIDAATTTYFVREVIDADTITCAASAGGALVDITSAGAGVIKLEVIDAAFVRLGTEGRCDISNCEAEYGTYAGFTIGRFVIGRTMGSAANACTVRSCVVLSENQPDLVVVDYLGQLTLDGNSFTSGIDNDGAYYPKVMCGGLKYHQANAAGTTPGTVISHNNVYGNTVLDASQYAARGLVAPLYDAGGLNALTGWDPNTGGAYGSFGFYSCPVYSKGDMALTSAGIIQTMYDWDGSLARAYVAWDIGSLADGAASLKTHTWNVNGVLKPGCVIRAHWVDGAGGTFLPAGMGVTACGQSNTNEVWARVTNNSGDVFDAPAGYLLFEAEHPVRFWL